MIDLPYTTFNVTLDKKTLLLDVEPYSYIDDSFYIEGSLIVNAIDVILIYDDYEIPAIVDLLITSNDDAHIVQANIQNYTEVREDLRSILELEEV